MHFVQNCFLIMAAGAIFTSLSVFADEPDIINIAAEKKRAVERFSEDQKVQDALKKLENEGYKKISIEALPYRIFPTHEGPASLFLVSAALGKEQEEEWNVKFVTARLTTDAFSAQKPQIIESSEFVKTINRLK